MLIMKSPALIFSCLVTLIFFVLQPVGNDNLCYRKALFFIYIIIGMGQMPFLAMELEKNETLADLLSP